MENSGANAVQPLTSGATALTGCGLSSNVELPLTGVLYGCNVSLCIAMHNDTYV